MGEQVTDPTPEDLAAAECCLWEFAAYRIGDGLQFTRAPQLIARAIANARAEGAAAMRERRRAIALETAAAPTMGDALWIANEIDRTGHSK